MSPLRPVSRSGMKGIFATHSGVIPDLFGDLLVPKPLVRDMSPLPLAWTASLCGPCPQLKRWIPDLRRGPAALARDDGEGSVGS